MNTSKVYQGYWSGPYAKVVEVDGIPLKPRNDLRDHSPNGFNWGYAGSGPAQLALAILADFLDDDAQAQMLYQAFKWKVIAGLPKADFTLTGEDIKAALESIK